LNGLIQVLLFLSSKCENASFLTWSKPNRRLGFAAKMEWLAQILSNVTERSHSHEEGVDAHGGCTVFASQELDSAARWV
jgi:diaminopimelate decarboxylase